MVLRQVLSHRESPWAWGVRETLVILEIDGTGDLLFPAHSLAQPHSSACISDQEHVAGPRASSEPLQAF